MTSSFEVSVPNSRPAGSTMSTTVSEVVTCPTLVASGRYDGIAPPSNGTAIAERIPGAELRIYEGGHAFFAQDRQALPDIIDFLAG